MGRTENAHKINQLELLFLLEFVSYLKQKNKTFLKVILWLFRCIVLAVSCMQMTVFLLRIIQVTFIRCEKTSFKMINKQKLRRIYLDQVG